MKSSFGQVYFLVNFLLLPFFFTKKKAKQDKSRPRTIPPRMVVVLPVPRSPMIITPPIWEWKKREKKSRELNGSTMSDQFPKHVRLSWDLLG